jgi:hypothetical protein
MADQKYVLVTDPKMPSRRNLWGIQVATSLENARARFKVRIENWHTSSGTSSHLRLMEEDRRRRLDKDDFDVELLD